MKAIRSYWQIFSRQITVRFAFLIPALGPNSLTVSSGPQEAFKILVTLSKVEQVWVVSSNQQVSLTCGYGDSSSELHLTHTGNTQEQCKVFSVSGFRFILVPLFNAYLFFRSQNTCSYSFLRIYCVSSLSCVPSGIISPEAGTWLSPVLQMREWQQRDVKHLARGYFAGNSGLIPRVTSLRGLCTSPLSFPTSGHLTGPLAGLWEAFKIDLSAFVYSTILRHQVLECFFKKGQISLFPAFPKRLRTAIFEWKLIERRIQIVFVSVWNSAQHSDRSLGAPVSDYGAK